MTSDMDATTVVLMDESGRSLQCTVEYTVQVDNQSYGLVLPVHTPVEFFFWEDEEAEDPVVVEDEAEIAEIFPTAKAVLEEQNLTLHRTAMILTVEGEMPDLEEEGEEWEEDEGEEKYGDLEDVSPGNPLNGDARSSAHWPEESWEGDEEVEEFHLLARFYHGEREYGVYVPLTPFLIPVRLVQGKALLMDEDEQERVTPLLEAQLEAHLVEELEDVDD